MKSLTRMAVLVAALQWTAPLPANAAPAARPPIELAYESPHMLVIRAPHLPGGEIRVNYLEAYCRAGSTDADWVKHTIEAVDAVDAASSPGVTSLDRADVAFTVPENGYVILRRGDIEAVIVDNRAVNDDVLPGHAAGYHGVASLRHVRQRRNLFVPRYSGLNFEHIHDGTVQERDVLFEPRRAPMQLRVITPHIAELHQPPTPFWGLESCHRYELRADGSIEMTFECIPRRDTFRNGYIGLFWASYIDQPESLDIHFRGVTEGSAAADWQRGVTPVHGRLATHLGIGDVRDFPHDPAFPLELPFGLSKLRYSAPWYFGICRGMAFVQSFRDADQVRFTQSPSGGGNGCPAWDFQTFISKPRVGQRYQRVLRAGYVPLTQPDDLDRTRAEVRQVADRLRP